MDLCACSVVYGAGVNIIWKEKNSKSLNKNRHGGLLPQPLTDSDLVLQFDSHVGGGRGWELKTKGIPKGRVGSVPYGQCQSLLFEISFHQFPNCPVSLNVKQYREDIVL